MSPIRPRGAASVHLPRQRARIPAGPWPLEMKADVLAALLDFSDTDALVDAILRFEAPRPTVLRGAGTKREPVWFLNQVEAFLQKRHGAEAGAKRSLARVLGQRTENT
jgi:hypothetical protein